MEWPITLGSTRYRREPTFMVNNYFLFVRDGCSAITYKCQYLHVQKEANSSP